MVKEIKVAYICDGCSTEFDGDSDDIKNCSVCTDDYCSDCQVEHAKEECGFD